MRTLLSQFCEEFESRVRPVLDPLTRATETLGQASTAFPIRQILPGLRERRHQLEVLADKVAAQQAYVLIFGPLKGGKSTLMNAMTGAYVSEVTALPAYPCLVFFSHGQHREFAITRFNGDQETLTDPAALRLFMNRAHKDLASRIREVEARGESFDPGTHLPEAIRRIDVRLPAGDLKESGAVLVDTPGLYSRMKIGYDRITRSFRDSAACAVFVVRSDNLFLDPVFTEFNQLLDLFSRIFLVVNLDSTKQDLRPDGSLEPSLESKDPFRIIEAFESLSMNAPLKQAAEEGRLRIYPVDLLRAASRRIREHLGAAAGAGERGPLPGEADFDAFLSDLTDYLNSNEYLVAFLGDSLFHAGNVVQALKELCDHDTAHDLVRQVEEVQAETMRVRSQGEVLQRLSSHGWEHAFHALQEDLLAALREAGGPVKERTAYALSGALDAWFEGHASLKSLAKDDLAPLLTTCQRDLARSAEEELRRLVQSGTAGMRVSAEAAQDLQAAGIRLDALARLGLEKMDPHRGVVAEVPHLSPDEIPVRRSFWDWVLFRSPLKVRRRLFGHPAAGVRLPKAVKAKRLGPAARTALLDLLEGHLDAFFPHALERLGGDLFMDYADSVASALLEDLLAKKEANAQRRAYLEEKLQELSRVRADLAHLEKDVDRTLRDLEDLNGRYRKTDPTLLKQPVEAEPAVPAAGLPDGAAEAPAAAPAAIRLETIEEV